jgi:hypothetical protein
MNESLNSGDHISSEGTFDFRVRPSDFEHEWVTALVRAQRNGFNIIRKVDEMLSKMNQIVTETTNMHNMVGNKVSIESEKCKVVIQDALDEMLVVAREILNVMHDSEEIAIRNIVIAEEVLTSKISNQIDKLLEAQNNSDAISNELADIKTLNEIVERDLIARESKLEIKRLDLENKELKFEERFRKRVQRHNDRGLWARIFEDV